MVPWLYVAFRLKPECESGHWIFDIQPGRVDPVALTVTAMLWCIAVTVITVFTVDQFSLWHASFVAALILGLAAFDLARLTFQHCDFPVRFTPLAACALNQGQTALRLVSMCRHPLCTVLTLRAHDSGQSKKESRLILWRYQYSAEQYRRMTLVLRGLSAEEHHE